MTEIKSKVNTCFVGWHYN